MWGWVTELEVDDLNWKWAKKNINMAATGLKWLINSYILDFSEKNPYIFFAIFKYFKFTAGEHIERVRQRYTAGEQPVAS